MATPSFLSEYELAREKQLARNAKKLLELGILQHKAAVEKLSPVASPATKSPLASAEARKRAQERRALTSPDPTRSSGRLRSKPAPVYRDEYAFLDDDDAPTRSKRSRGSRGGSRGGGTGSRSPWDNTSWPLGDAARHAAQAAATTMDALPNPSFCKIMLPSMVSGGFWMEAPQGLPAHMPQGQMASKHPFLLVRPEGAGVSTREETPSPSLAPTDAADEWRVVWLIRKGDGKISGGGFSGGWRGCAIDLKLAVGDAIVFEVLPQPRDGLLALQMRIHRARDPDSIRPAHEVLAEHVKREEEGEKGAENDASATSAKGAIGEIRGGYTKGKQSEEEEVFAYSKAALISRGGKKRARVCGEGERLLMDAGGAGVIIAGAGRSPREDDDDDDEVRGGYTTGKQSEKKATSGGEAAVAGGGRKEKMRVGAALVGAKVEKAFDGEMYGGVVKSFDPKMNWYLIEYDDGDTEEMNIAELRRILLQAP